MRGLSWVLVAGLVLGGEVFAIAGEAARGRGLYLESCARCHGDDGAGDGPDGKVLETPPADLRQRVADHSDDELVSRIRSGEPKLELALRKPKKTADTDALYDFLVRIPKLPWKVADGGRAIYLERCAHCHGWYGKPVAVVSPRALRPEHDLADPAFQAATTDRDLVSLLRHDRSGMPRLDPPVRESDVDPLRSFLRLLWPGYELYSRYCVSCHGRHGKMGEASSGRRPSFAFDDKYLRSQYPDDLRGRIWHMLKGARPPMPHFGERLSVEQVRAILAHLRSLPRRASPADGASTR